MSDIGSASGGNRVLLLRSLNFHTSPAEIIARLGEEIARMVGKQGREKEAEAAVCRVALVVDAQTKSRWGYAFVELVTAEVSCAVAVRRPLLIIAGVGPARVPHLARVSAERIRRERLPRRGNVHAPRIVPAGRGRPARWREPRASHTPRRYRQHDD